MKSINRCKMDSWLTMGLVGFVLIFALFTPRVFASEYIKKSYEVAVRMFSIQPDQPLDTYKFQGSGAAGVEASGTGATLGLACGGEDRRFSVNINPHTKAQRLFVKIIVKPHKSDTLTKPNTFDVELADLKAKSFELAKNKDGRVYILNIVPKIKIVDNTPKRADDSAFQLGRWTLNNSIVIVNDQYYAGKIGVSGGQLAYIDIGGLAKVEFALKPFRDAKPLGMLQHGQIKIELDDETTIDIYDVKNGVNETQLPGGPYEVWVRVKQSSEMTTLKNEEEWLSQVKAEAANRQVEPPPDDQLRQKYRVLFKDKKYAVIGNGVMSISPKDRIE